MITDDVRSRAWEGGAGVVDARDGLLFSTFSAQSIGAVEAILTSCSLLDERPRFVIGRDRSLIVCSDNARAMLDRSDILKIDRGLISFVRECDQDTMGKIMSVSRGLVGSFVIVDHHQGRHAVFKSVSLGDHLICLSVHRSGAEAYIHLPALESVFGLTRSEVRIVEDLYNGLTPQEVAVRREVSIHTVRAHLRRCYDKLSVRRREQLWRVLRTYQI